MKIPQNIGAGLTFSCLVDVPKYPAPDWALSIALRGPLAINLTATAEGRQHRFQASAETTSAWQAGKYWYSLRATSGFQVVEIERSELTVTPDMAAAGPGFDGRTHAEICLANIEAVLEKRSTMDQDRYRINNRELYRTPVEQLLKLRDLYRAEVRRERMAASGQSLFGQMVRVRLK